MKTSTKQTLLIVLLLITIFAVVGVGVLSYLFHRQVRTPQTKALEAIPNRVALFFETKKPADFFAFNAKSQPLFTLFLGEKQQENIQQIVSMLKDAKPIFDVEKHGSSFYLSVHSLRREIALLFGIEVNNRYNKDLKMLVLAQTKHLLSLLQRCLQFATLIA